MMPSTTREPALVVSRSLPAQVVEQAKSDFSE
jgi:hypothetical protein